MTSPIERSMIALHRKARHGPEQRRLLAESLEMLDRLVQQQIGLAPRALRPKQGDEGLLARGQILADALSGLLLLPFMVDQIVDDLEGEADVAGIAAQAGAALGRHPPHDRPRFDA